MKIFFTASFHGKKQYQRYYNIVLKTLEQIPNAFITSTEKDNYLSVLPLKDRKRIKNKEKLHYLAIKRNIQDADAVVIEMSNEDFQLGHEATLAIQNKKYVLCLSTREDFSEKIINRYFVGAKYNEYNIEEVVDNFIEVVKKNQFSERFNCFISPSQMDYVKEKAKKEHMNASEYIRSLIDDDKNS